MDHNIHTEKESDDDVLLSSASNEHQRQALEVTEDAREREYVNPSFGRKLFLGEFDPSMVYPFPVQSEEDKKIGDEYLAKMEAFLKENVDPEEIDRTHEIPKSVIEGLAKLKAFAIKIPKEYGGLGFSNTNYNRVIMLVGSYCASTSVLLSAHQSIGIPQPLLMYGSEEQKKKFLPRFADGAISAFALTEPSVGSDPAQMSCEAKLSDDGKYYILNGEKLWCTNGTIANIIVVIAKTAPKIVKGKEKKQISAFVLEMDTPGVEVAHRCEFMGLHGIYNGLLRFKDVKIPRENLIWEEGKGLAMALGTINVGRLTLPSGTTAGAKLCTKIVREWGKSRVQWGQPIGYHEPGSEKIAYIASHTLAMEAVTWLVCSWADQKKFDIRIEAAMSKMFCTETLWKLVDMTMQLRGGRGYETARSLKKRGEKGIAVERMMRDCRINMILEGSTEIMKLFLAREAMDPHLKRSLPLMKKSSFSEKLKEGWGVFKYYAKWYPSLFFKTRKRHEGLGKLEKHFQYIDQTSSKLARTIFYYMAKYQQKLEKKQLILGRLMEIGTELFVMAATCSYAISIKDKEHIDTPLDLADFFCVHGRRLIEERFDQLEDNMDNYSTTIAKEVLDDKYVWLEDKIIKDF